MPKGLGEVSIPNPYQKVKDKLTWSCKYFHKYIFNSITKDKTKTKTLLSCFLSYLYHLIWAQQCLIQSDVEQLQGAPSVHSFTLVYFDSSQLLLKATDLDWVQVNLFTIEAVDNIHLL